jgi:hypothetical protein
VGHRAGVTATDLDRGDNELSWPTSIHAARRFIMRAVPDSSPIDLAGNESQPRARADEPPVLNAPNVIEGRKLKAIRVAPSRGAKLESQFAGFLDGVQDVRIVNHSHGIPIVWATVSAAIRVRHNRRLTAWEKRAPAVSRRYYLPLRYLDDINPALRNDPRVVDTAETDASGKFPSRHPAALLDCAIQKVQRDREDLEQSLAEAWCIEESEPLYVDGSIAASAITAESPLTIGVVKSHRTLYADGDAFRVVVGLESGERSSVFRVSSQRRHAVASWYVRLRGASGRDALFGLVRVEAAESADLTARADEISRWIIAEGAPLALPDGRWDKMTYGIRDTEEFLRAIS